MIANERRAAARIRAYLPVKIHRQPPPQIVETLTKNISSSGIRCISTNAVLARVASPLSVELVLEPGHHPIALEGRTVWFQTIPHSEQFECGIEFVNMSPENQRRLSTYCQRLANQIPAPIDRLNS